MTTSINQLRVKLKELQQSHLQLNDFFWGDFLRAYKENELNYPVMGCFYPSGAIIQRQTSVQLTIYVADKVYKDYRNLNDVESDTLQICRDLFNVINDAPTFKIIGRVESCNVTKFIEKGGDEVAGHQMTLSFKLRDSGATCGLPIEGFEFNLPVTGA